MTLNEYQSRAMSTCTESSDNFVYMGCNLVGEVGEFFSKVAKAVRKEKLTVEGNDLEQVSWDSMTEAELVDLMNEAGDILWQLSGLCSVMGWSLQEVASANLAKLASRAQRGVIVGNGDNR